MRIFRDLLFLHGHIADVELARSLAGADTAADDPVAAVGPATPASATAGRDGDHAVPPCATDACA